MKDELIKMLKEVSDRCDNQIVSAVAGMRTADTPHYQQVRKHIQEAIAELLECS